VETAENSAKVMIIPMSIFRILVIT
jgi:hypothetical protein